MRLQYNPYHVIVEIDSIDFASGQAFKFLDEMKRRIPAKARRYNPKDKTWQVTNTRSYREILTQLVEIMDSDDQTNLFHDNDFDVEAWLSQFDKPREAVL